MFGIGDGSLKVELVSIEFRPGQSITGKIHLDLPKSLKGRGLQISFYGELVAQTDRHSKTIKRIHEVVQNLAGEKTYNNGEEYQFSLSVPSSLSLAPDNMPDNPLANFLKSQIRSPTTIPWVVHAQLDIPLGLPISAKVQLKPANL